VLGRNIDDVLKVLDKMGYLEQKVEIGMQMLYQMLSSPKLWCCESYRRIRGNYWTRG